MSVFCLLARAAQFTLMGCAGWPGRAAASELPWHKAGNATENVCHQHRKAATASAFSSGASLYIAGFLGDKDLIKDLEKWW